MRKKVKRIFILISVVLAGTALCANFAAAAPQVVQTESVSLEKVSEFLKLVPTVDYHQLKRKGELIFKTGLYVPTHREIFEGYSFEEQEDGNIRYDFLIIEGRQSSAWISLFLENSTGKIVMFSAGEAWNDNAS